MISNEVFVRHNPTFKKLNSNKNKIGPGKISCLKTDDFKGIKK
jgi:hypothetical protein